MTEILMSIIILISAIGHVASAGIYNYLSLLPILYFLQNFSKHIGRSWFFSWRSDPDLHS